MTIETLAAVNIEKIEKLIALNKSMDRYTTYYGRRIENINDFWAIQAAFLDMDKIIGYPPRIKDPGIPC